MFKQYSLTQDGKTKIVVFHFILMKFLILILGIPTIIISIIMLFEPLPFPLIGLWWLFLITIFFCLILPIKYQLSNDGDRFSVDLTKNFWRKKSYKFKTLSNVKIAGKSVFIRPSAGGIRIELTKRKYKPYIIYEESRKNNDISLYPVASYLMKGNYTQLREEYLKEISDHLGIGYKIIK